MKTKCITEYLTEKLNEDGDFSTPSSIPNMGDFTNSETSDNVGGALGSGKGSDLVGGIKTKKNK